MIVNYLKGGERPTATLMNDLFGALDDKITRLLGGRSFFLAQTWQVPQRLCGKAFFFTSGKAIYAPRVPGYIDNGGAVARPYNHQQFLSAMPTTWIGQTLQYVSAATLANGGSGYNPGDILTVPGGVGIAATIRVDLVSTGTGHIVSGTLLSVGSFTTLPANPAAVTGGHGTGAIWNLTFTDAFDETNKIVSLPRIDSSFYQGLPQNNYVQFFDWSLAAHYIMHQGSNDPAPTKYYVRELSPAFPQTAPEKHLRYGLAEIIIEGVTNITIEKEWDKYNCLRLHNLNPYGVTVKFGADYTVVLGPFQCVAVRRDAGSTNYRKTYNYFFPYDSRGLDPRFYWFMPSTTASAGLGVTVAAIGDDGRASNTMQANNLSNPAILYDWVQFFQRTSSMSGGTVIVNPGTGLPINGAAGSYANFIEDVGEQCDAYPFYKKYFGDPGDPKALIGDLIHHKGDIMIIRASKTKTDPITSRAVIVFDTVTFNGYATIVQDFAAKKIIVTENSAGNLQITNGDADNNVWLISLGTNLFKTGDTNTQTIFQLGTITIETAIFEDQSGVEGGNGMLALATSGPQLINQPALTSTKQAKTWYDTFDVTTVSIIGVPSYDPNRVYNPGEVVNVGGYAMAIQRTQGNAPTADPDPNWNIAYAVSGVTFAASFYKKYVVPGTDIQTLNWNIGTRGLLQTPTILDGGSGYQDLDTMRLKGGSGDAAVIQVMTAGGKVTSLTVVYPGNYTSPPDNPNAPGVAEYIYPDQSSSGAHHGSGLRLGNISVPLKTLAGIHKFTVADILKMDWWGDPRFGDQNSNYVTITGRKLTLTPQGLALTFTEQDSSIRSGDAGLPAGFPRWTSGNRGLPRTRLFKFRGHGWGYVSEAVGSYASAFLAGREGRFFTRQDYQNEVAGIAGDDFAIGPLNARETVIQLLSRVKTSQLTVIGTAGRFWKSTSDSLASLLEAIASMTDHQFTAAWQSGSWTNVKPGTLTMALLPEMYNAMARAVNAVKSGMPLSWKCLRFIVDGNILDLNPGSSEPDVVGRGGVNSGRGPGTGTGFICQPGGPINTGYYGGPRPMNQYCSFYVNSLFEKLCQKYNIPVRSPADFPGDDKNDFKFFQEKKSMPAVYYDSVKVASLGTGLAQTADDSVPANDPSGRGVDIFSGRISLALDTVLLESQKILDGVNPGGNCVGTFDPFSDSPDTSTLKPGQFIMASDGSGIILVGPGFPGLGGIRASRVKVAVGGRGYHVGEQFGFPADGTPRFAVDAVDANGGVTGIHLITQFNDISLPLPYGPVAATGGSGTGAMIVIECRMGSAMDTPLDPGQAWFNGAFIDLLNGFDGYRWIQLEDVKMFIQSLGFEFNFAEAVLPLKLKYFKDPTQQQLIGRGPTNSTWVKNAFIVAVGGYPVNARIGPPFNIPPQPGVPPDWAPREIALIDQALDFAQYGFSSSGYPGHGTLTKFCQTEDKDLAYWKVSAAAGGTIDHVASRNLASPIVRFFDAIFEIQIVSTNNNGFAQFDPAINVGGNPLNPQHIWKPGDKPTTVQGIPTLAVMYVDNGSGVFRDLVGIPYSEDNLNYSPADRFETLGILRTQNVVVPLKVLLAGDYVWAKMEDSWNDLDVAKRYVAGPSAFYDGLPWQFYPAPASFQSAAGPGLTIFSAPHKQQRYYALFDLTMPAIDLQ